MDCFDPERVSQEHGYSLMSLDIVHLFGAPSFMAVLLEGAMLRAFEQGMGGDVIGAVGEVYSREIASALGNPDRWRIIRATLHGAYCDGREFTKAREISLSDTL